MKESNIDPSCLMEAFADVLPIDSTPPPGIIEHRAYPRYTVSWRIAVSAEGQDWQEGKIRDISLNGAAVKLPRNLKPGTRVTLNIQIPSLSPQSDPKIMVIHGKIAYSILDTQNHDFRIGLNFIKYEQESDYSYLEQRLTKYQTRVL